MLSRIDEKLWHTGWYYFYYPLYILSLVGFNIIAPRYLGYFTATVKIYISLLLIWKFNPIRSPKPVTTFDREIIFKAGTFLFLTTVIGDILMRYDHKLQQHFGLAIKGMKLFK